MPTHPPAPSTSAFMRQLGHALRNVMGTITVSVEVLRSGAGGATTGQSALDILGRQSDRLEALMATALALASAVEGTLTLSRERLLLGEWLAAQVAEMQPPVAFNVSETVWVEADAVRLGQAVRWLLDAVSAREPHMKLAVDIATAPGSVILRMGTARATAIDRSPTADMAADEALVESLGLEWLLVAQTMVLHGGSVAAQATPAGPRFTVRLPLSAPD